MKKIKLTSQQKKERALIVLLVIVALALVAFCVKAYKADNAVVQPTTVVTQITEQTTTVAPPQTTSASQTTSAPQTTAPVQTTKPVQTTAPVDETQEIIDVITRAVMSLKSSEASFTGHKVQNIDMKLVDSSMPAMNDFVNSIIGVFVKEEVYDYDFTDGVAVDPENGGETTSNSTFPPGDCEFRITKEGVAKATKEKDGENTVYTIIIVAETSTLENPRPPHHNAAADTLDLSSVEIPVATITKADFEYPGATISVTINPEGEVVCYYEKLFIKGTGEAKAIGLTGYGTIDGFMEEKWDIEWK